MKVYKVDELFEATLNLGELSKISGDGTRGDILVNRMLNRDSLTTGDGDITPSNAETIARKISTRGKYDPKKGEDFFKRKKYQYQRVIDKDDDAYRLSDIQKTSDFSPNSGPRQRSINTRNYESLACLVLSYRQMLDRELTLEDIDDLENMNITDFRNVLQNVRTSINITQDLLKKYYDFRNTFLKTANAMYNTMVIIRAGKKRKKFSLRHEKTYTFYQISEGSGVYGQIVSTYKNCGHLYSKKFGSKLPNMAKWNPSDIWAVESGVEDEIIESISRCRTITSLNKKINNFFYWGSLVGISLKKVTGTNDINIVVNKITDPPVYTYRNIRVSRDPFHTIGVEIITDRESFSHNMSITGPILDKDSKINTEIMVIRSSNSGSHQNVCGEMRGKSAQQGKISLTSINKMISSYTDDRVPYVGSIKDWDTKELKRKITELNNRIINTYDNIIEQKGETKKGDARGRLYSKYQALYLSKIFMDIEESEDGVEKVNDIISEMFYYALSIKFGEILTPKYVRVID